MIRPHIRQLLRRYAEPLIALCITFLGVWIALWGGWFFGLLGLAISLTGLALVIGAWRRLPFHRAIAAAGIVELDEGILRYLTPFKAGGEMALADLTEIRLMRLQGDGFWRLRNRTGEALLIPINAAGSEKLAGAFATLPDLDMGRVASTLANFEALSADIHILWRK